ncbi:hypothetical protein TNCV_1795931 [Trichonephila clavipes]|nr:hypothetical protein TNCV_1795931 [Trichonephila clavipes]
MPWIPLPLDKGSEEFMEMEQKQERYGSPVSETEVTHVVGPVAWGPLIIDMVDTAVATQLSEFESRTDSVFDAPITQDELAYVLRNHPCGKSPGGDGIHSEFLAYLGPRAFQTVWKFFDLIWNTETSGLLAKEQAGFRSSKSIHQHPALVSQLVKDALDNRQALTAVFIDLKSAYDNNMLVTVRSDKPKRSVPALSERKGRKRPAHRQPARSKSALGMKGCPRRTLFYPD